MMLKPARLLLALTALVAAPVFAQNAATVNGKAIPSAVLDKAVKSVVAQGRPDTPELRAAVKQQLINREVLVQEAMKQGLAAKPEVKDAIEANRQQILIAALQQDYAKKNQPTEKEMQAEYDKAKAAHGDKEYKARHILVETEAQAKDMIAKIKAGQKFEDLAKANSKDGSAANGGDLDWASPANYVADFSNAMVALKKGEVTENPVKSQFGYHVIKLDDIRPAKFPTFEEAKQQVANQMLQKRVGEYAESLIKKANVK
jgi:peptidyl-prolyl cis-trans isomerase C